MSRWFRHYAGMMRDEKLVSAAIRSRQPVHLVVWVWGAILESAAEIDDGGRYDLDAAEAAYFLRTDEGDICAVLDALAAAERVVDGRVAKWGDRQYQSDKSAGRQARYRERKRSDAGAGDAPNVIGDVTPPSRDAVVTAQDTDTDTEIEKEEPIGSSKKRGCRLPDDFVPDLSAAVEIGLTRSQAEAEAAKFRDYWVSIPGAKGVKLDWPATWRNWVRQAVERLPQARGSPISNHPSRPPSRADVLNAMKQQVRNGRSEDRRDFGPDGHHGQLLSLPSRAG